MKVSETGGIHNEFLSTKYVTFSVNNTTNKEMGGKVPSFGEWTGT